MDLSDAHLLDHFSRYGEILNVSTSWSAKSGTRMGFVRYRSPHSVYLALDGEKFNAHVIHGPNKVYRVSL
jgi:hypothetical protein